MTPKKLKTRTVEKSDYKIYLAKAKDFYEIMLKAHEIGRWTAVGLNAVHCAIQRFHGWALSNLSEQTIEKSKGGQTPVIFSKAEWNNLQAELVHNLFASIEIGSSDTDFFSVIKNRPSASLEEDDIERVEDDFLRK